MFTSIRFKLSALFLTIALLAATSPWLVPLGCGGGASSGACAI